MSCCVVGMCMLRIFNLLNTTGILLTVLDFNYTDFLLELHTPSSSIVLWFYTEKGTFSLLWGTDNHSNIIQLNFLLNSFSIQWWLMVWPKNMPSHSEIQFCRNIVCLWNHFNDQSVVLPINFNSIGQNILDNLARHACFLSALKEKLHPESHEICLYWKYVHIERFLTRLVILVLICWLALYFCHA